MKAAEWAELVRRFLPDGQEWAFSGFLGYRVPVGRVLLGVELARYSDPEYVRVYHVVEPLFIPLKRGDMYLTHEIRIPKGHMFNDYDDPFLRRIHSTPSVNPVSMFSWRDEVGLGIAISHAVNSSGTELTVLRRLAAGKGSEQSGYAQLLLGDSVTAVETLGRAMVANADHDGDPARESRERAALVRSLLETEGPEAAMAQLDRWVEASAANLRLRRMRESR